MIAEYFDRDYVNELLAISKISGVELQTLVNMNFFAEIFCVCISVIMETEDGQILHGRNLDFHAFQKEIMDLSYIAKYYEGGKHLYTEIKIAGMVGTLSGYKPDKFAINAV